jgi:glycosyltransferase involved in cell wall biosynthesis
MQKEHLSKDEEGIFMYTQNIVDKINYLESNPDVKEKYKTEGKKYILENFNINKVGKMWEDAINELVLIK